MHIHNVYFWLDEGLGDEELAELEQGLQVLTEDPGARGGHCGRPASTDREVVDSSYGYGLVIVFDDLAAHDAYQASDVHLKFVADQASKWTKVVVYDIETG